MHLLFAENFPFNWHNVLFVFQCLQVLQRLTYNVRILHCASHVDDLLTFLMLNMSDLSHLFASVCILHVLCGADLYVYKAEVEKKCCEVLV